MFKNKCNYCGKIVDVDDSISVIRGKKHSCKTCAGNMIRKLESNKKGDKDV